MAPCCNSSFDGAATGNSFAGTPQVHPCRLSRDVPVAHTPQKISRRPRLDSVVNFYYRGIDFSTNQSFVEATEDPPRDIQGRLPKKG